MALNCPACKHENEDVIPGCGGHIPSLFGTPTFTAPTGETYAWIRCEKCRTRFWAAADFPDVADNQYLEALTVKKCTAFSRMPPRTEEASATPTFEQAGMHALSDPRISEATLLNNSEVHHG